MQYIVITCAQIFLCKFFMTSYFPSFSYRVEYVIVYAYLQTKLSAALLSLHVSASLLYCDPYMLLSDVTS
jgi:hypothetical protein